MLLRVVIDLPSGPKPSITKEAYPRNLKLTREYQESKGGLVGLGEEEHTASGASAVAKAAPSNCPDWPLGKSDISLVKQEISFTTLHADSDNNMKLMYLRSCIGVAMEALAQSLPSDSGQDFLVVHRKNNKGI